MRSRQPDVTRGGHTFPAQDGSSDCGGIRDCERAGHSGQEGETRDCSAWLSGWPGASPCAELGALRARSSAACSARASQCLRRGGGPGCPETPAAEHLQVATPYLGFRGRWGPPPRDLTSRGHAELIHYLLVLPPAALSFSELCDPEAFS